MGAILYARLAWAGQNYVSLPRVLQYADTAAVEKQEDAAEQAVKQAKLKAIERLLWGADADPLTVEPGELSSELKPGELSSDNDRRLVSFPLTLAPGELLPHFGA